ncbi:ROK family protein [Salipaludibacillus sp. CF4.18]|uniref:ROK family protein n=1 Tax=Salipaludibacillus sp. CF4.18 TaxID=3373081 RepID=UPI003EE58BCE
MKVLRNGSKELIKEINRFKVLNIIRKHYPISRIDITEKSNLGPSTLSYIMEDLKKSEFIFETVESSSTGGRRAKLIEFNKEFGYIVGVKIEEMKIIIALTNMNGEIKFTKSSEFQLHSDPETVVNLIQSAINDIFDDNQISIQKLLGIGVLSSGLVNRNEGIIIRSSMLDWKDVNITEMLKNRFSSIKIFVDNNINGYTLAELWEGEGVNNNNFLVVSVGAGIGLSVVIDRKIYYGAIGGAGEFGHTTLVIDGYDCHCGQKGCLEMYASDAYFENKGQELIETYSKTILKDFTLYEVAQKANQGDDLANRLFGEMGEYLGYGIRNLINTLNPETIVLAGEGMNYSDLFYENLANVTNNNFFSQVGSNTKIVKSKLDDNAWLVGGALLAINHIFQEPIYEKAKVHH